MTNRMVIGLWLAAMAIMVPVGTGPGPSAQEAKALRVVSESTATGFKFPESVAYDPAAKVLYVSQFGSELQPTKKDGQGRIARVSLTGSILEDRFLPAPGQTLDKPKGLWVQGHRLWVTDIDVAWVFDLQSRRGRKVALPGAKFANDPTVKDNVLWISDNRGDQLFRVEPADFLDAVVEPKVTVALSGKSVNPNGVYPARDGSILMVGFMSPEQARGIYALDAHGGLKTLAADLGRLDGLAQLDDGSLLVTDWNSGTLFRWSAKTGREPLAGGFKGPADLTVAPDGAGLLVVVPDLVKSELRLIHLAR